MSSLSFRRSQLPRMSVASIIYGSILALLYAVRIAEAMKARYRQNVMVLAAMNPLHKLLMGACSITLASSCGCPEYPCESALFLNGECADKRFCQIDGQTVGTCRGDGSTPDCPLWRLPRDATLTIRLDRFRDYLGARNDLRIHRSSSHEEHPDLREATLRFDGSPASGCESTPAEISCDDVPASVRVLEFSYEESELGIDEILYVFMHDAECEATHSLCEL